MMIVHVMKLMTVIMVRMIITMVMEMMTVTQVAGAWSERQKMFHGGSFLKLADDDV